MLESKKSLAKPSNIWNMYISNVGDDSIKARSTLSASCDNIFHQPQGLCVRKFVLRKSSFDLFLGKIVARDKSCHDLMKGRTKREYISLS